MRREAGTLTDSACRPIPSGIPSDKENVALLILNSWAAGTINKSYLVMLGLATTTLLAWFLLPLLAPRKSAMKVGMMNELQELGRRWCAYHETFGREPATLAEIADAKSFRIDVSNYELLGVNFNIPTDPCSAAGFAKVPLMRTRCHIDDGRAVLYLDGHVEWVREDNAQPMGSRDCVPAAHAHELSTTER